ncbi:molybdenum cofactor biosynthesis protein MoaE [Sphingomonas arenae]|uniref:molybdenum cofactor biosynthesis protein MoaE n=1 Tax=Sphingomonas arenae TaxID=2812555 RepID=UPI001967FC8D|nr:molybdenum cofactor biosynthesis protein MoaE [Sphingomonas arenae]
MWTARLVLEPFSPEDAYAAFQQRLSHEVGAVVTFAGLARGANRQGAPVDMLVLEHHPRLTQLSLEDITASAAERFEVSALDVIHRAGHISPGDAIVWAAAAAPHRRAAFEAADYLMDRLKTEAMFWKREDGRDGSRWIEPTDTDHHERARWE